jgi:diguanylate cyclase (GGDEF)-like protein
LGIRVDDKGEEMTRHAMRDWADISAAHPTPVSSLENTTFGERQNVGRSLGGDLYQSAQYEVQTVLDLFLPFHLLLDERGVIQAHGPGLCKLPFASALIGSSFQDHFAVEHPHMQDGENVCALPSATLMRLRCPAMPDLFLKAVGLEFGGYPTQDTCKNTKGGRLVNLSFGLSVARAVEAYGLQETDFAQTDLAADMLFLLKAKSAAIAASLRLTRQLQGAKDAAEEMAFSDALTGLRNRRVLTPKLAKLCSSATPFSLMHLDLDYFKAINDTLGHAAGDFVLQQVAHILQEELRRKDIVIRQGGDEFVLIFEDLVDPARLRRTADRLIARIQQPMLFQGHRCAVSASIGIAISTAYSQPDPGQIMQDADAALYVSKRAGRGQCSFFDTPSGSYDAPTQHYEAS